MDGVCIFIFQNHAICRSTRRYCQMSIKHNRNKYLFSNWEILLPELCPLSFRTESNFGERGVGSQFVFIRTSTKSTFLVPANFLGSNGKCPSCTFWVTKRNLTSIGEGIFFSGRLLEIRVIVFVFSFEVWGWSNLFREWHKEMTII